MPLALRTSLTIPPLHLVEAFHVIESMKFCYVKENHVKHNILFVYRSTAATCLANERLSFLRDRSYRTSIRISFGRTHKLFHVYSGTTAQTTTGFLP